MRLERPMVCCLAAFLGLFAISCATNTPKDLPLHMAWPIAFQPATAYVQEIFSDEPLGHWRLDDEMTGAISGEVDHALKFEGETYRVLESPSFGGKAWTAEMWVGGGSYGTLLSYASDDAMDAMALSCEDDRLVIEVMGEVRKVWTPVCQGYDRWWHLGVTWRSGDGELIVAVDGDMIWRGSAADGAELPDDGALVLGQRQGCVRGCFEDGFVGVIDEVALYDRALSPSRLFSHALVGWGARPPSPIDNTYEVRIQPQFTHGEALWTTITSPDGRRLASADVEGRIKLWDTAGGRLLRDLDHHTEELTQLAFSPDGRLLVSASFDTSIKVWDALTGELLHDLQQQFTSATSLAFSPDGKVLATASARHRIKLWELGSGRLIRDLDGPPREALRITFSPDGRSLYAAESGGSIRRWRVSTGTVEADATPHTTDVFALSFSPNGAAIASGGLDGQLRLVSADTLETIWRSQAKDSDAADGLSALSVLWFAEAGKRLLALGTDGRVTIFDTSDGRQIRRWVAYDQDSGSAAISWDGRMLATSQGRNGPVRIWNALQGQKLVDLSAETRGTDALTFGPNGRELLLVGLDNTMRLWSATDDQLIGTFDRRGAWVSDAAFSPDGRKLATAGGAKLWDIETGRLLRHMHSKRVSSVAFSPDGKWLALGTQDKTVELRDAKTGALEALGQHAFGSVTDLVFSPDSARLASAGDDGHVIVQDVASGLQVLDLDGHSGERIVSVVFSPDGARVISSSDNGIAVLWDARTGAPLHHFIRHTDALHDAAISPDGKVLATAGEDRWARLWNAETGEILAELPHSSYVEEVSFSPDGKRLATRGGERAIKLWRVSDGRLVYELTRHTDHVNAMTWSPDGRVLATAGQDRTARLWDVASGMHLHALELPSAAMSVAFSPDGQRLAMACRDRTVRLHNLTSSGNVIFVAEDHRWLAFTDEGYFDASPDGASLVAMVQGSRLFGIDQFALRYNRPDKLINRLGCGELTPESIDDRFRKHYLAQMAALGFDENAVKERAGYLKALSRHYLARHQRRLRRANLEVEEVIQRLDWPSVRIIQTRASGEPDHIDLDFALQDRKGLASYQIYVNDVPLFSKPQAVEGRRARLSVEVALTEGRNKIEVAALNERGVESLRALTTVDHTRAVGRGDLYFVGFGVSNYLDNTTIPDLNYAHQDVLDLAAYFEKAGKNFDNVHIHAFIDEQVTPKAIGDVKEVLDKATVADTVILFVAGHGMRDEDAEHTYYYLPHGVDLDALSDTGVPFEDIERLLYDSKPRNKLFLMDTCQSGEFEIFDEPDRYAKKRRPKKEGGFRGSGAGKIGSGSPDPSPSSSDLNEAEAMDDELDAFAPTEEGFDASGELILMARAAPNLLPSAMAEDKGAPDDAPGASAIDSERTAVPFGMSSTLRREWWRDLRRDRFIYVDLSRRSGAIVLSSSRGGEASLEGPALANGAFTEELLNALRTNQADEDGDGWITTDELRAYVIEAVPALTGGRQHPTVDRDNLYQRFALPIVTTD